LSTLDNAARRSFRFLGLLRRPLLSFLHSVPAGQMDSAHRSESFRGSPLIELESLLNRLDAKKIFGRRAALHVDLGCGDGSFLCALAQRIPEKNFLGIERLLGRFRSAAVKVANIRNVRVLRMESSYVVRYLLPPRSVETFYLLFPDPWPKRRHWRRRIVTPDLLKAISQALVQGGRSHRQIWILRLSIRRVSIFRKANSRAFSSRRALRFTGSNCEMFRR